MLVALSRTSAKAYKILTILLRHGRKLMGEIWVRPLTSGLTARVYKKKCLKLHEDGLFWIPLSQRMSSVIQIQKLREAGEPVSAAPTPCLLEQNFSDGPDEAQVIILYCSIQVIDLVSQPCWLEHRWSTKHTATHNQSRAQYVLYRRNVQHKLLLEASPGALACLALQE